MPDPSETNYPSLDEWLKSVQPTKQLPVLASRKNSKGFCAAFLGEDEIRVKYISFLSDPLSEGNGYVSVRLQSRDEPWAWTEYRFSKDESVCSFTSIPFGIATAPNTKPRALPGVLTFPRSAISFRRLRLTVKIVATERSCFRMDLDLKDVFESLAHTSKRDTKKE